MTEHSYRLIISCPDRVGIVAAVSGFFAREGGLITEANHYLDPESNWFFTRQVVSAASLPYDAAELYRRFAPIAEEFGMTWHLTDTQVPKKVVLMASKQTHCLSDLLYRWRSGDLSFDIPCVISNHEDLRSYVEWHDVTYHHVPVNPADKAPHFAEVARLIEASDADVIVLARYMQILPPHLCEQYPNRIINIHHSFLPAFIGARPYHQAAQRGVKLIGATAHYVTAMLDEGPIIEQEIERVDHSMDVASLAAIGRDVESVALARAVKWHAEHRILLNGAKTVIFR